MPGGGDVLAGGGIIARLDGANNFLCNAVVRGIQRRNDFVFVLHLHSLSKVFVFGLCGLVCQNRERLEIKHKHAGFVLGQFGLGIGPASVFQLPLDKHFLAFRRVDAVDDGRDVSPGFAIMPICDFVTIFALFIGADAERNHWGAVGKVVGGGLCAHATQNHYFIDKNH